jgi:hypothetical protein
MNPAAEHDARTAQLSQALKYTKMCDFFMRNSCRRGNDCCFAHSVKQLQKSPELLKTILCDRFHLRGSCKKGANCNYAHSEQELRSSPLSNPLRASRDRAILKSRIRSIGRQDACFPQSPLPVDCKLAFGELTLQLPTPIAPQCDMQSRISKLEEAAAVIMDELEVKNTFFMLKSPTSAAFRSRSAPR